MEGGGKRKEDLAMDEEELAARVLRCEEISLLHMVVIGFGNSPISGHLPLFVD